MLMKGFFNQQQHGQPVALWVVSEGRGPSIVIAEPASCTSVSGAWRNKNCLMLFAAPFGGGDVVKGTAAALTGFVSTLPAVKKL